MAAGRTPRRSRTSASSCSGGYPKRSKRPPAARSASAGPGDHLGKAWSAAYRRSPNASEAYREAVAAVEAAAIPLVIPKNPKGTLGTVIIAMRDAPQKWVVAIDGQPDVDQVQAVKALCELLWKGHTDRHGSPDETHSKPVTPEAAEAAEAGVHLAILLVQLFTAGDIRPA